MQIHTLFNKITMKNQLFASLLFLVFFFHVNTILSQTSHPLVTWDFNGKTGQSTVDPNFVAGGISSVSPSSLVVCGSGFNAPPWSNGLLTYGTAVTLAEAISKNVYASFTITPSSSQPLSITSVRLVTYSFKGERTFSLLSSIKGFNDTSIIGTVKSGVSTLQTIPITNHINISGPTEFRVYFYGATSYWPDYYLVSGLGARASSELYDLAVDGYIPDSECPTAPTALVATNIASSYINLSWSASTDNIGISLYEIFKDGISVGTTSNTSFLVDNLVKSKDYSFVVKAKDINGNVSEPSAAYTFTTAANVLVKNDIGINLFYASDWCSDHAFADVMLLGRVFYNDKGLKAAVDANGWPTEDAFCIVWHGITRMNGMYKLRFNGKAKINAYWSNSAITNQVYDPVTNTTTADLNYVPTNNTGIHLALTETNGGVQNVKLMRPIEEGSTVTYDYNTTFTTPFKNVMSKFSTIRFLNWSKANGSRDSLWADRTQLNSHWASNFKAAEDSPIVPWETIIQLCNETNCNAWINVPVKATDDYIRELAKLWKQQLNPNLKLHIEFSNELWNSAAGFSQFFDNVASAKAEVLSGSTTLNFDGEKSLWYMAWRRIAKRTVEISNIFREVWGDDAMMTRVRPVLMWQQGDGQGTASEALKWLDYYSQTTKKPINYYLYGAGGSAYYGPDNNDDYLTLDNIWQNYTFDTKNWLSNNIKDLYMATAMGCKRMAYEGGPSMDNHGHSEAEKAAAWNDPRMEEAMIKNHNFWSQNGGDLLMYYCTTGDYQWGFSADIRDTNTPKFNAINALNEMDKSSVSAGRTIPFTIGGGNVDYMNPGWVKPSTGPLDLGAVNNFGGYLMRCEAGNYNVSFDYSGAINSVFQFQVDGMLIGEETINAAGTTSAYSMKLDAGLHALRIVQKSINGFKIKTVYVKTGAGIVNGIHENNLNEKKCDGNITLYPNPANDFVNVNFVSEVAENASVEIYDLMGKNVYRTTKSLNIGHNLFNISTDLFRQGIYTMKIVAGNKRFVEKLIVR